MYIFSFKDKMHLNVILLNLIPELFLERFCCQLTDAILNIWKARFLFIKFHKLYIHLPLGVCLSHGFVIFYHFRNLPSF